MMALFQEGALILAVQLLAEQGVEPLQEVLREEPHLEVLSSLQQMEFLQEELQK